jgi:pimeloyl-ACP methyl ester carboxylesterase
MNPTHLIPLIAFVLALSTSLSANPAHVPTHWTEGYVYTNGIRMHYWRSGGEKPPLIMAHGYSDDGLCWTTMAKELDDEYDVILPDARGFGLTDPPSQSELIDVQVEDLAGFIKALKLEDPILLGHSMGSASVAWFAARYPDVPRASILVDPRLVPRTPPDTTSQETTSAPPPLSPEEENKKRAAAVLKRNNTSYEDLFNFQLERNPHFGFTEIHFWALSKQLYHPNTAYRNTNLRPAMSDLFPKTTCPTLILKADDQGELQLRNEEVAAILKDGHLVHVEGAGHSVHRDRPEFFLKSLRTFLDTL